MSIANRANQELEQYFEFIKYLEIERLREQAGLLESMGGDPEWPLNEDDLEIQTWENTSEVDALKLVIENRDTWPFSVPLPPESHEYSEGKDYEFFAVLSLWMLADALAWADRGQAQLAIAGEYALKAMDAVCYAEHLREAEILESFVAKQGEGKLVEALKMQKAETQKQKSDLSRQLNLLRHRKTNEAKAMAIEEFMKDRYRFPSAEKAGIYLADWLRDQRRSYEPRTVSNWIRAHAKSINFRFR